MKVEINISMDTLDKIEGVLKAVEEIERAHSIDCTLRVEVFKRSDLLNCAGMKAGEKLVDLDD